MKLPRVYPILDTQSLRARACAPETAARAWLDAGARILQFRHKGQWTRPVFEQAEQVAADAGFTEVGRMSREPRDGERFRRGHLLMRAGC